MTDQPPEKFIHWWAIWLGAMIGVILGQGLMHWLRG